MYYILYIYIMYTTIQKKYSQDIDKVRNKDLYLKY